MRKNMAFVIIIILAVALAVETGYLVRMHQESRSKQTAVESAYPIGASSVAPRSARSAVSPFMSWRASSPVAGIADEELWDPVREMADLQRMMDRMFKDSVTRGVRSGGLTGSLLAYQPDLEMKETNDEYIVRVDLPGIDKDKMDVKVQNGLLTISGERTIEKEENNDQSGFYRTERSFGSFMRSVPLPADAAADRMTAEAANGVLTVHIPKVPGEMTGEKKVEVK